MATYTTNLDLKKPETSDKIRIADINNNMDDIDAAFGAVGDTPVATQLGDIRSGMAIVSTGNAHDAIAAGQFVYVMGHDTLDDGLYTADSALAANATLSSSNVTAVSGGGLNALNSKINTLTSGEKWTDFTEATPVNGSAYGSGCRYRRVGCFVHILIGVQFSSAPTNTEIFTLPVGYRPIATTTILVDGGGSYNAKAQCTISDAGVVRVTSVDKWVIGGGLFVAVGNL